MRWFNFPCNSLLYEASFLLVLGGLVGLSALHSAYVFIFSTIDSDTSSATPSMVALDMVGSSLEKFASMTYAQLGIELAA